MPQFFGDKPRVLLTGGSGNFGQAFIRVYADRCEIIAVEHRAPVSFADGSVEFDPVDRSVRSTQVKKIRADLMALGEIDKIVDIIAGLIGPIDWLINAAANTRFLGDMGDADTCATEAAAQFHLNTITPTVLTAAVARRFWRDRPANIAPPAVLNLSSISGEKVFAQSGQGFYAASKAALNMLTLHMASDLSTYGVCVNALSPGPFASGVEAEAVAKRAHDVLSGNHTGRIIRLNTQRSQ